MITTMPVGKQSHADTTMTNLQYAHDTINAAAINQCFKALFFQGYFFQRIPQTFFIAIF